MTNAVCGWDFTIGSKHISLDELKKILTNNCKKWSFQLEIGEETGYEHYQGRVSLKVKKRLGQIKDAFFHKEFHFSITSTENTKNMFYVNKSETRIAGPWSDQDKIVYIPRQYQNKLENLRPFQKDIWDSADIFEDRKINCIVNESGNIGKSVIASLCELYDRGIDVPPVNDSEKIIQSVCNILQGKNCREPKLIFLDIPRSVKQEKLNSMFVAIEQIKKGKVYDFRYHYQEWWFDSPQIWVFMNIFPKTKYLSRDRWSFFEVNQDFELVPIRND